MPSRPETIIARSMPAPAEPQHPLERIADAQDHVGAIAAAFGRRITSPADRRAHIRNAQALAAWAASAGDALLDVSDEDLAATDPWLGD